MTAPVRVQDVLGRLVTRYVAPPLKAAGLRREGRGTWYEQGTDGGWVLPSSSWAGTRRATASR